MNTKSISFQQKEWRLGGWMPARVMAMVFLLCLGTLGVWADSIPENMSIDSTTTVTDSKATDGTMTVTTGSVMGRKKVAVQRAWRTSGR